MRRSRRCILPPRPVRLPGLAKPPSQPDGSTRLVLEPDLNRLDDPVEWHF